MLMFFLSYSEIIFVTFFRIFSLDYFRVLNPIQIYRHYVPCSLIKAMGHCFWLCVVRNAWCVDPDV